MPLAAELGSKQVLPCDVTDAASMDAVFAALAKEWGRLDFLVHAIAFSDKNELDGRYADTTEKNFTQTMLISSFSLTALAKRGDAIDLVTLKESLTRSGELEDVGGVAYLARLIDGVPRAGLASFDLDTGSLESWTATAPEGRLVSFDTDPARENLGFARGS